MALLVENTGYTVKRMVPVGGTTSLLIRTLATVDATDTIVITLNKNGIGATGFIGLIAFVETTDDSVYAQELCTTAVAAGVLTITVPAGTNNDRRHIVVFGHSINP